MKRALSTVLAMVVSLLGFATIEGQAPAEAAGTALNGFEDIVVDTTHGKVFISTGANVVVTDLAGQRLDTVGPLADASALALDGGNSTLFVARPDQHTITAVDTETLAVTDYPTPERCPTSLAPVSGDVVWFTGGCHRFGDGPIYALEVPSGEVTAGPGGVLGYDGPEVSSVPSSDLVSLIERGVSPGTVTIFDTSVDELGVPHLTQRVTRNTESIRAAVVRADGSGIVVSQTGDFPQTFSTTTLAPVGDPYRMKGTTLGARHLAASADGWLAADERTFAPGEYLPFKILDVGYPRTLQGYAWGTGRLYVVTSAWNEDGDLGDLRLKVVTIRAASAVKVSVPDPSVTTGANVPVTIKVNTDSTARRVKLYAIRPDGDRTLLASPTVDDDGVTVSTKPRHNTVYRAVYAGDGSVDPARAEVAVTVKGKVSVNAASPRHVGGQVAYYRSGDTVNFVGRVRAFRPECLNFNLEIRRSVQWLSTDIGGCVRVENGRARFRLRSEAGEEYYRMRMRVWLEPTDYNVGSNAGFQQVQLCRRDVPCAAP